MQQNMYNTIQKEINRTLLLIFIVLGLIMVFVVIPLTYKIRTSIVNPVNKALYIAKEVAEGNLNVEIEEDYADELGQLVQSLKEMTLKLKEII